MTAARVGVWLPGAIRIRTLPASVVPVFVGTAAAAQRGAFEPVVAILALLVALSLQVATNLVNDYGDHVRGADGDDRIGPARASQSAEVDPRHVAIGGGVALLFAAVFGAFLIARGGWPVVWIGLGSLVSAVAYTAGPYPLAYHGLGEVFVFAFFGPVAVLGTEFLQAGSVSTGGIWASVAIGLLAAAILLVNNVRDVAGDERAGKRTIVVRLGRDAGRRLYAVVLLSAFGAILVGVIFSALPLGSLLSWFAIPLARRPMRAMSEATDGPTLNATLADTARLEFAFGALLSVGFLL